jgi:hypothetical protein
MGQVRSLDIAINSNGYLRLSTSQLWVQHLGNTLEGLEKEPGYRPQDFKDSGVGHENRALRGFYRKGLIWLHNQTFDLLYRGKSVR